MGASDGMTAMEDAAAGRTGHGFAQPERIERSAGGVVVRSLAGVWHALVIRDPYGNWSLPKGHIEGGESLREAAAREVEEETGLAPEEVGPKIATVDWTFRYGSEFVHKYCTFFLMRSRFGDAVPQLDEGISVCRWLPVPDAAARIVYDNTRAVVLRAHDMIEEVGW